MLVMHQRHKALGLGETLQRVACRSHILKYVSNCSPDRLQESLKTMWQGGVRAGTRSQPSLMVHFFC